MQFRLMAETPRRKPSIYDNNKGADQYQEAIGHDTPSHWDRLEETVTSPFPVLIIGNSPDCHRSNVLEFLVQLW